MNNNDLYTSSHSVTPLNVVWFKRDLRLQDHAPLAEALARQGPILALYIVETSLLRDPHYRRRHWHFIAQSLVSMQEALSQHGGKLWVLEGDALTLLAELHRLRPIDTLLSYEETGLEVTYARDRAVADFTQKSGICPELGLICLTVQKSSAEYRDRL